MKFTDKLWKNITPIYEAILAHPFNRELIEGTLSTGRFLFYIQQDSLYLVDYCRALTLLAGRCPDPHIMEDFICLAQGVIAGERGMQDEFFKIYGIQTPAQQQCPSCFMYTNYLISTVTSRTYPQAVAAVLPCFWIYREVGSHIFMNAGKGNPYRKWIDTYSSEEFSVSADKAIEITNAVAAAFPARMGQMEEAFETAARLEWMFWDSAYRGESWRPFFMNEQ
ncbi:MAG: TenA family protein [Spirochaetales bacterium]|jgi:thiaminase/transcriptional activator TenA|nr:TenA family protein [Spirochaetales bacterium]